MPKCLDCDNTKRFWYKEMANNLGVYNEDGTLDDVEDNYHDEVEGGECAECESKNIEGKL